MSQHTPEPVTLSTIMSGPIPCDGGERRITIRIQNPGGLSNHQTVDVVRADFGFDWESGQLILTPAKPLTKLTPEQVAEISESARQGQSWHAYQTHKRHVEERGHLAAQRDDLLAALERLQQAFVVAVGDKSPFAKEALRPADEAIAKAKGETNE